MRIARPLVFAALLLLALASVEARPQPVQAQAAPGEIAGSLPERGFALVSWGGGTPDLLASAAVEAGCALRSLWVTRGGALVGYIPGAPGLVNRAFLDPLEGGVLPAGPAIVVCSTTVSTSARAIEGSACRLFPDDNPWGQDVRDLPVHPNSDGYIQYMLDSSGRDFLHPDFGSDPDYGIPWVVVPEGQPELSVTFDYDDESDPGPYPIPADPPIEAGSDHHILIVRDVECRLYELFDARRVGGRWEAGSGAIFDLESNALRPDGWTSADAAGLPIFAGLVRYAEVQSGSIDHALRVTFPRTQRGYIHPATHFASSITDEDAPPMGLRLRLRADFDLSGYTGDARVVLEALRRYGMIVADNGSAWYVTGETNTRWDDDDLNQLKSIPGTAFEVVDTGPIRP